MRWSSRPVVLLPQTVNSNLSSSIATAGTTRWRQASGGSAVARQLRALGRACPSLWLVLLLLLLLPLSCLLRYHLGTQRDRASAWSTYYHREAQGAQQQLELCTPVLESAQAQFNAAAQQRRALVQQRNGAALVKHRELERCVEQLKSLRDYSSGKLEFTRAKLHAQAEGSGDQKLRFAVYECLTKLDDKLRPEDVWQRNVDDETLRNTLISLMAAKLGYGVRHLQATETEALIELANCEPPDDANDSNR